MGLIFSSSITSSSECVPPSTLNSPSHLGVPKTVSSKKKSNGEGYFARRIAAFSSSEQHQKVASKSAKLCAKPASTSNFHKKPKSNIYFPATGNNNTRDQTIKITSASSKDITRSNLKKATSVSSNIDEDKSAQKKSILGIRTKKSAVKKTHKATTTNATFERKGKGISIEKNPISATNTKSFAVNPAYSYNTTNSLSPVCNNCPEEQKIIVGEQNLGRSPSMNSCTRTITDYQELATSPCVSSSSKRRKGSMAFDNSTTGTRNDPLGAVGDGFIIKKNESGKCALQERNLEFIPHMSMIPDTIQREHPLLVPSFLRDAKGIGNESGGIADGFGKTTTQHFNGQRHKLDINNDIFSSVRNSRRADFFNSGCQVPISGIFTPARESYSTQTRNSRNIHRPPCSNQIHHPSAGDLMALTIEHQRQRRTIYHQEEELSFLKQQQLAAMSMVNIQGHFDSYVGQDVRFVHNSVISGTPGKQYSSLGSGPIPLDLHNQGGEHCARILSNGLANTVRTSPLRSTGQRSRSNACGGSSEMLLAKPDYSNSDKSSTSQPTLQYSSKQSLVTINNDDVVEQSGESTFNIKMYDQSLQQPRTVRPCSSFDGAESHGGMVTDRSNSNDLLHSSKDSELASKDGGGRMKLKDVARVAKGGAESIKARRGRTIAKSGITTRSTRLQQRNMKFKAAQQDSLKTLPTTSSANLNCFKSGPRGAQAQPLHLRESSSKLPVLISHGKKVTMLDEERKIFVIDLLSPQACKDMRKLAEEHCAAKEADGNHAASWRTLYTYTKMDLPCGEVKNLANKYTNRIMKEVSNVVGDLFGDKKGAAKLRPRSWKEPHMLKYQVVNDQPHHKGVEMHYDGCDITWQAMLSSHDEYTGGGTYIRSMKQTIRMGLGQVLVHPGELYHKGVNISSGIRMLVVCFMDGFDPKISDDSQASEDDLQHENNVVIL